MKDAAILLEELCNAHGVSGYEDEVRAIVERHVRPLADEVQVDPLGNLIAWRRSATPNAPTLMIDAHLDEIGMVVSYVEASGFLRFALVGGWDERVLPAHAVTIRTREAKRIRGVIGVAPPHIQKDGERGKPYAAEALFIDVGARNRDEVAALGVRVGDSAVPDYPFARLAGDAVVGKALDNRAGCAALIEILRYLAGTGPLPVNVATVFSTFEETGARGAKVAAHTVSPQIALVLEGTVAGDFPGVPEGRSPSTQGRGPAITLMDKTTHCAPKVVRFLEELALRDGIPHQFKTPISGGTDAARIHISRGGVLTGVISVPCRYIHSPHATLRLSDFENTVLLGAAFARECHQLEF
ncbi:MAG: M42 family metallopeptidase [Candidatus Sumerlaeaceae bacterium]|nr:M42 family metallopeptidase [Candidatus Sumerlaeaceae bacterium]